MEKEIWKDIEGYEGLYQVSSYGRVRSLGRMVSYSDGRKRLQKGRILKPAKDGDGYLQIVLSKSNVQRRVLIHRLVAQMFLTNPDNLPQVNHKDENKTNNFVFLNKDGSVDLKKSNLEWCTQAYNNCYGTRLKRQVKKLSIPVLQLDVNTGQVIAEYPSAKEVARQLNISNGTISECCNGKRNTAYGYKWRYK